MNKQLVAILILLGLVSAAVFFLINPQQKQSQFERSALLPALSQSAEKISRIDIANSQGRLISATRQKATWTTELANTARDYPLDQAKLSDLVSQLKTADKLEAKTRKPNNFDHLGLRDISEPDSQAVKVTISAAGKTYAVLVGKFASSGQGSYARLVGDNQTWLLDRQIPLPAGQVDWLRQPILDISAADIASVLKAGEQGFNVVRLTDQEAAFALADMPQDQQLKYPSIVDGFVNNLVGLNFEQISQQSFDEGTSSAVFNITLIDGSEYEMRLFEHQQGFYVQFTDMLMPASHYWEGITYQVSNFAAAQLQKRAMDFVQAPEVDIDSSEPPVIDEGESPG